MNVEQLAKNAEKIELTGEDVHRISDGKATIMSYTNLENYDNLDMAFGPKNNCLILLYEIHKNTGHWVCLIRNNKTNEVEFFDSYGIKMDGELAYTHYYHESGVPHLTRLVQSSGYILIENRMQYQEWKAHTNTCGRWSAFRCRMSHLSLPQFKNLFSKMSPKQRDYNISLITMFL